MHFSIVANRALRGEEEGEEKHLSRQELPTLIPFILVYPFAGLFAPYRPFSEPLGQSGGTCRAQCCLKKGGAVSEGVYSFYSVFILLGSGSLLLSCSSPSPCRLTSIPLFPPFSLPFLLPFSPLLSSLFSKRNFSLSGCMNTAEFHLNPRTWELWAKREEQRTLLFHIQSNYSTYIIELSLQRSLHYSTLRNRVNKQKDGAEKGEVKLQTGNRSCLSVWRWHQ